MADAAVKNAQDLAKSIRALATKCYPDFAELILYSLERRHLDIPEFSNVLIPEGEIDNFANFNLQNHLKENVRLVKVDEISFDSDEEIHLPGVESAITSMRNSGHSLIFIVQGDSIKTSVFMGLSKFKEGATDINSAIESYTAAWKANFPGSKINKLSTEEVSDVSFNLAECKNFGVLTGIPSLKRDEDSHVFVQGVERLIRAMRGKIYCWVSIADPVSPEELHAAIDACQKLQSEIHHLVKTDLSKATSSGKTVMLGLFGMLGQADTEGTAKTISETISNGSSEASTHTVGGSLGASALLPLPIPVVGNLALNYAYSMMNSTFKSVARGVANCATQAVSQQMGGGGFGSLGFTLTKTTTVGQELLNRKVEYAEEVLKAYEKRLHEGTALGMWNLGHYFCADNEETYTQGVGVVTSLFTGMDSTYEPPRALKVPSNFCTILRKFNNVYLHFSSDLEQKDSWKKLQASEVVEKLKSEAFLGHPLGIIFNGPCTPVNTKELAIATPIAMQDIEGVSISERAAFGINLPERIAGLPSLTVGRITDKGNEISQRYQLLLENLPKHLAVFGLTGSGKTNTVHNLLIQLWKVHHIPFLVLEPAKSEYRALADLPELKDDLLVISAGINQTSVCPLRLNPFDFEPGNDTDANRVHLLTHIDRLRATFNASFPMYASMPYILEEAILEIYRERGWDLGRSVNRYVDIYKDNFRPYIPTLKDLYLKVDEVVRRKGYFQEQQMNIQAALKSRLSSLMVGAKGEMFNSPESIPADDLFNRPVVIELENMGDDDEKAFLMGLLVSKLYEYRKATFSNTQGTELPFKHVLVIEEAHRLLANIPDTSANMESANVKGKAVSAFVDMLSEIRALGQSVFIVDQLPSRVSPNIVKGTGTKIVHRLLAKDDRETVGWTMGMNEDQINDLCLLKTGECVVNQDGDRKSFMCKVNKNDLHENRTGDEVSVATGLYKKSHSSLFVLHSDHIDMENVRFRDELYKTMLAIGIGQKADTQLSKFSTEIEKTQIYWQQICREIWSYYCGNFQSYLEFCRAGANLLRDGKSAEQYRTTFQKYFKQTSTYEQSSTKSLPGTAYEQLFLRNQILVAINKRFDMVKGCTDSVLRLGIAIKNILPTLLPANADKNVSEQVVTEILSQVAPQFTASQILSI